MTEEWKDIKGYEGQYQVSNYGRILSLARVGNNRTTRDRIMKQYIGKTGYKTLRLCKDGKTKLWKAHILVAKAFVENPSSLPIVNHKDGDKCNNRASNLEWCTYSNNEKHAYSIGLRKTKPIEQRNVDDSLVREWKNISTASNETGIKITEIYKCCTNTRRTAGGYKWQYTE